MNGCGPTWNVGRSLLLLLLLCVLQLCLLSDGLDDEGVGQLWAWYWLEKKWLDGSTVELESLVTVGKMLEIDPVLFRSWASLV